MAETPLVTLVRLLGGVVLLHGRLGHQVLGQLLVMNSNEVALAGASLVIAATTGQRSAVGQIALRTVVPALAVRALLNKQEQRLQRTADLVAERTRAVRERERRNDERAETLGERERRFEARRVLATRNRELEEKVERLVTKLQALETTPSPGRRRSARKKR